MSRSFASRSFIPAVWIVAVALVAAAGVAGVRTHSRSAAAVEQQVHARVSLDAIPLGFEANQGQTDPAVKYMARGSGYTVFLTENEAVFALKSATKATDPQITGRHFIGAARPSNSPSDSEVRAAGAQTNGETAAIHLSLLGAKAQPQISASNPLPGHTNYFIGNDRSQWQANVAQYARVSYREVYPGVDMAFYGGQKQLEFDFIVAPGASASPIRLGVAGADRIATDDSGNLVMTSAAGDVVLHKPAAYQEKDGTRQPVDVLFVQHATHQVGFVLGNYDHSRELVIDPSISYATYLGGASEDEVFGIAVDSSNNVYLTGESNSTTKFPGRNAPTGYGFYAFVIKLNPQGTRIYTTFLGGTKNATSTNNDSGLAIAADSAGAAYVTGITESTTFPVSANAPQPKKGDDGGNCTNAKRSSTSCSDAFAFKLNSTGTMVWSTFIGGQNEDDGYGIALDNAGNVWVAGDTFSSTFDPNNTATNKLSSTFNNGSAVTPPADDGFVVEISPAGTAPFLFSTYLGGTQGDEINGIAVDQTDNSVYVTGETDSSDFPIAGTPYQSKCGSDGQCNANAGSYYYDGFVTKIAPGGTALTYSTYIGGSSDDYAFAIALDASGDAYVTGETTNDDPTTTPAVPYPTTSGAFSTTYSASAGGSNAFVTELNPTGSALVYSTFLGGNTQDFGGSIAVDQFNDAYVTGMTASSNFPVTSNAFQAKLNGTGTGSNSDAFVTQVLAGGASLGFSSYLGGSGSENSNASGAVGTIALDSSNNIWVGGSTNSATVNSTTNFPTTTGAMETTYGGNPYDGFVAEISSATVADFNISATTPAAVSPGTSGTSTVTLTSLFGYDLPVNLTCSASGTGSPLPACSASSFSTTPVTLTSNGTATSTVTITTTGSTAALKRPAGVFSALWLPIVGLSLVGMHSTGSRRKRLMGFLLLGLIMATLVFMPACSSGSSNSGGGGGGGTPAGSYTITITGTDANNLSHSTQVTLTVN